MHYEPGKSYAWFMSYGRGYLALFAYPGNKATRYLKGADGKPVQFGTSLEAVAAAQLQVRRQCERDIVATVSDPVERTAEEEAADRLFAKLQADVQESGQRRADEDRRLRTETFTMHKAGRKPVVVETKRRSA